MPSRAVLAARLAASPVEATSRTVSPKCKRPPEKTFSRLRAGSTRVVLMAEFTDIKTWTERLGRSRLRMFRGEQDRFWLEQNSAKASKWAKLAREGHQVAWEFESPAGAYTGRVLIDGVVYTTGEAKKFFE